MKHLPWLLLAAVLAYPLLAQGTVGKVSLLRGPLKVYGIPHPDEWLEIESNTFGSPAVTYTVPVGHRLTLVAVFKTPGSFADLFGEVRVDGVLYGKQFDVAHGEDGLLMESGQADGADDLPPTAFVRGTVLKPGQAVEVKSLGDASFPSHTFTLRGFLEEVK